jgi:hypothetical protein
MWRALLQDVELMPQHQDFGFKPWSRLETVAQHADEKEGNSQHPAIMCRRSRIQWMEFSEPTPHSALNYRPPAPQTFAPLAHHLDEIMPMQ